MKKYLLLVSLFFLMQGWEVHANWYGSHQYWHNTSGMTECDSDGDITGWAGDGTSDGKDYKVIGWDGSSSGYMTCVYWDGANPSIVLSDTNASWRAPFSLTLNVSDLGGSGLQGAKYNWDSPPDCNGASGTSFTNGTTIPVGPPYGSHTLHLCARDNAGNIATRSQLYRIDNVAPLITASPASAAWTNTNVTVSLSCTDPQWTSCTELQYIWSTSATAPGSFSNTINGTNPTDTTTQSSEGVWYLHARGEDAAMPNIANVTFGPYRIDKTVPTPSDVSDTTPPHNSNLLAYHAQNFSLTAGNNGGAPITTIEGEFENHATPGTFYPVSSSNATLSFNASIERVDNSRDASGRRVYNFRVTRVCDAAWNCTAANPVKSFAYNVYANTLAVNATTARVSAEGLSNSANVADGTSKNLAIELRDLYGNAIIPASGIGRQVHLIFDTENSLHLNQYNRSGNAVFINIPGGGAAYNSMPNGVTSFSNLPSSNGAYAFSFKAYTPTSNQNVGPVSDLAANFDIQGIQFQTSGTPGATTFSLGSSSITSLFNPLYSTSIAGELRTGGFIEGATQSSTLSVAKNALSSVDATSPAVELEFGGANSSAFTLYGGTTVNHSATLPIGVKADIQNPVGFPNSTHPLYTKLVQNPWSVENTNNTYLSSHIAYTLDGLNIVYNSDIVGKPSFHSSSNTELTRQAALKILGLTSTKASQELVTNQFSNDVKIIGDMDKLIAKTEVIKNAYSVIKNVTPSNGTNTISSLTGNNPSGKSLQVYGGEVLYFSGGNVTLSASQVSGKRTILVVGGNLHITQDMYYSDAASMLGVIVLKDANGVGGNIYVRPSVTNIVGTLFAEKSIISHDGLNELDGSTSAVTLRNQLHIYGGVFSENTIGGSRKFPAQCPYYITSGCPVSVAQKYDLNYLRRYYLVGGIPANNGEVIGGGTYNAASSNFTGGNYSFMRNITTLGDPYLSYPVVIEYNAKIQSSPPPLFVIE